MAEQDQQNGIGNGAFGIPAGVWRTVGNMSAMAILAGAFLVLGNDYLKRSDYDRQMFRDELKALRDLQNARWEKTDATHEKAMTKMAESINRAVTSMEKAAKAIEGSHKVAIPDCPPGGGP